MVKSQFIDVLHLKLPHLSRQEVEKLVDTVFDKMIESLRNGERIELRGFGTFEVRHRVARQGRNPKSGATVYVQNRKVPFFRVGKDLQKRLNRESGANNDSSDLPKPGNEL